MSDVRIRRAEVRDLDRVLPVWQVAWEHHAALDAAYRLPPDRVRELLRAELCNRESAAFVHESSSEIDGLCTVRRTRGPGGEAAEITYLAVLPERRRSGTGRKLVEAALAWIDAQAVGRTMVRVAAGNAEGQAFWRALGFTDFMDVLERPR